MIRWLRGLCPRQGMMCFLTFLPKFDFLQNSIALFSIDVFFRAHNRCVWQATKVENRHHGKALLGTFRITISRSNRHAKEGVASVFHFGWRKYKKRKLSFIFQEINNITQFPIRAVRVVMIDHGFTISPGKVKVNG